MVVIGGVAASSGGMALASTDDDDGTHRPRRADAAWPGMARATGRAMGTNVAVNVIDGARLAPATALERLAELEGRWSRFRGDSELSRVGDRAGRWTPVHPETVALLRAARMAWEATAGACDVTGDRKSVV